MRSSTPYAEGGPVPDGYVGFDPDVPIEGFYRHKLTRDGIDVAVRIWFGAPLDPIDGSELDRAPRWLCTVNGRDHPLARVWPNCAERMITEAEAEHLVGLQEWGAQNGHAALANPRVALDPLTTPSMF